MRYKSLWLLFLVAAIAWSSCSVRRAQRGSWEVSTMSKEELVQLVNRQNPSLPNVRVSAKASLPLLSSQSVRLDVSISDGRLVRLLVVPMPLFELGRAWFEPQSISVQVNPSKLYCKADWRAVSHHLDFGLDYTSVEAILVGRVFSSSQSFFSRELKPKDVELEHHNGTPELVAYGSGGIRYRFGINEQGRPKYIVADRGADDEYWMVEYDYLYHSELGYVPDRVSAQSHRNKRSSHLLELDYSRWRVGQTPWRELEPAPKSDATVVSLDDLLMLIETL